MIHPIVCCTILWHAQTIWLLGWRFGVCVCAQNRRRRRKLSFQESNSLGEFQTVLRFCWKKILWLEVRTFFKKIHMQSHKTLIKGREKMLPRTPRKWSCRKSAFCQQYFTPLFLQQPLQSSAKQLQIFLTDFFQECFWLTHKTYGDLLSRWPHHLSIQGFTIWRGLWFLMIISRDLLGHASTSVTLT